MKHEKRRGCRLFRVSCLHVSRFLPGVARKDARRARGRLQGGEIMSERKRFERLSRYFAGLSFAQRRAAAILVIVIVATAIWFGGGNGAGRSPRRGAGAAAAAMEPLLDQ